MHRIDSLVRVCTNKICVDVHGTLICKHSLRLFLFFQVRGVEIGIVLLVLVVWIGAIALFFNRWGKIRMLLPYQPDYKEQLKVPGTAACAAAVAAGNTCTHTSGDHMCSQVLLGFLINVTILSIIFF